MKEGRAKEDKAVKKGRKQEDTATTDKRQSEDKALSEARAHEDRQHEARHGSAAQEVHRQHEEDRLTPAQRDRKLGAIDRAKAKERGSMDRGRAREDKAREKGRGKEDKTRERGRAREDRARTATRAREDKVRAAFVVAYNPDQPRDDHGRFGEGGAGDKPAMQEHTLGSLHDAARAKLAGIGQALYDRLPAPAQRVVDFGQHVEHQAEAFYKNGQDLAKEVARGAGLSEKHVETVGRVLAYADTAARWGVNWQVAHAVLEPIGGPAVAFAGAKASYYTPVASLAYVAAHMGAAAVAGRNPLDVVRQARERIRARGEAPGKHGWRAELMAAQASDDKARRQFAEDVTRWLDGIAEAQRYWAEALLAAALDQTRGDMPKALGLAKAEFDAAAPP